VSDAFWYALFGFLGLLVVPIVKEFLDRKRAADAAAKVQEVATKAAETAEKVQTVADNLDERSSKQEAQMDVIHKAVNGNTTRLEDKIDSLETKLKASDKREAEAKGIAETKGKRA
jgi:uncharacterized membrane protein YhiD involved in acid resistance